MVDNLQVHERICYIPVSMSNKEEMRRIKEEILGLALIVLLTLLLGYTLNEENIVTEVPTYLAEKGLGSFII